MLGAGEGTPVTLYTVGYQHMTPDTLAERLLQHGIRRLVDVRMNAFSRKRGFSAPALFESMRRVGIAYEHRCELGNPAEIRALYQSGRVAEGRAKFRAVLSNGKRQAVGGIVAAASSEPTAIMCLESEPALCHRSVIAEVAAERSATPLRVVHL